MKEGRKPEYPEKTPGDELLLPPCCGTSHCPGSPILEICVLLGHSVAVVQAIVDIAGNTT